ncbi:MAG TPA: hypothetical protein VF365_11770 [Candidatus Limnocylindria bacterium]
MQHLLRLAARQRAPSVQDSTPAGGAASIAWRRSPRIGFPLPGGEWDHAHMSRPWLALSLIAIGVAVLIVAPMAQSCVTELDHRVCETAGTIVLNVVGAVSIAGGTLWSVLLWHRRQRGSYASKAQPNGDS